MGGRAAPTLGPVEFFFRVGRGPRPGRHSGPAGKRALAQPQVPPGWLTVPQNKAWLGVPRPSQEKKGPRAAFSGAWQALEWVQCEQLATFGARGLAWLARGAGGAPLPPRWLTPHHLVGAARPARAWCSQGRSPLPPKLVLHSTHAKGCKRSPKNSQWAFLPPWWLTSTRA